LHLEKCIPTIQPSEGVLGANFASLHPMKQVLLLFMALSLFSCKQRRNALPPPAEGLITTSGGSSDIEMQWELTPTTPAQERFYTTGERSVSTTDPTDLERVWTFYDLEGNITFQLVQELAHIADHIALQFHANGAAKNVFFVQYVEDGSRKTMRSLVNDNNQAGIMSVLHTAGNGETIDTYNLKWNQMTLEWDRVDS